jgi:hypothetical protein
MICSDAQLELALDIKSVTNEPLLQTEGDRLVCAAKLMFGELFERAAKQLADYNQANELLMEGDENSPHYHVSLYHRHIKKWSELTLLNDVIGDLALHLLREGHLDRSNPPTGVWALCKMRW